MRSNSNFILDRVRLAFVSSGIETNINMSLLLSFTVHSEPFPIFRLREHWYVSLEVGQTRFRRKVGTICTAFTVGPR